MYYNNIYFENPLLGFFISIFLSIIIVSVCFSNIIIKRKQIYLFSKYQPIIFFFLIFSLIVVGLNFLIILNLDSIINIFLKIFLLSITFYFFYSRFYLKNNKYDFVRIFEFKKKKLFYLIFSVFFLITLLPISDADSISIHQLLANYIYLNGLDNINLYKDVEFLSLSNSEILLIVSPILKIENFGALLNFLSFFLLSIIVYKKKNNFLYFLFSCPLIIFLISTQKLQLFFGILYLILFILVNENLIKKKLEIFIFIFLLAFYASAKINYVLFAIPLYLYFLITKKSEIKLILIYSLFLFLFVFFPIFLIKYIYFGNPVSPFFDSLFSSGRQLYDSYALSLRSSEGWLLTTNYKSFLRPFIPTNINQLSSSLGLIFLLLLLNFELQKKTKFFPLLIILLIISTGQILPRYYLEAFLILSFYFFINKYDTLTKLVRNIQFFIVLSFSIIFLYISYFDLNVLKDKSKFLKKFSYTYFNSKQYENISLKGNVLDLNQTRTSIFFDEKIFSTRYLLNQKLINTDYQTELLNYIDLNKIKYIVSTQGSNQFPECLNLEKIGEISKKTTIRNFLVEKEISKSYLYELNNSNC